MENDSKYPPIVYKYRTWHSKHHQDVIKKNELFLSPPKDFNEPFDCRIPSNYYLLDTPDKIEQYANEYTIRQFEKLNKMGVDIEDHIKLIEDKLTNDMSGVQIHNEEILFSEQDKRLGVLSLTKKWDNILMWSHYGDFHKGYCIGFWEEKLRNSKSFGKGGMVTYSSDDNYPEITPLNDQNSLEKSYIETHYKAKDWNYEEEYRLTRLFYPDYPTDKDRTIRIENNYFVEIILGIQMPENQKIEIRKIAKEKNIAVYQARKVPFKF